MKDFLNQASELVFIMMALGAIILTFLGKVDAKDFMLLATAAFGAYFGAKIPGSNKNQTPTQE